MVRLVTVCTNSDTIGVNVSETESNDKSLRVELPLRSEGDKEDLQD